MPAFEMPPELPTPCVAQSQHTLSLFDLSGKTALVTGGNGGIGGGMCRGLAEAGANIIIFQIPGDASTFHEALSKETGCKVDVYDCDMGSSQEVRDTVQRVLADGHNIDILCNVAGISSGSIPIWHETDEHKDAVHTFSMPNASELLLTRLQIIQINFNSVWILSQCICRHMVARGKGGKVINISSLAAHKAMKTFSVYGPMKAAVAQLTNSFANEYGPYDIQVNAILPG